MQASAIYVMMSKDVVISFTSRFLNLTSARFSASEIGVYRAEFFSSMEKKTMNSAKETAATKLKSMPTFFSF